MNTLVVQVINVVSILCKIGGVQIEPSSIRTNGEGGDLIFELKEWEDVPRDFFALCYRYLMTKDGRFMAPMMEIYMGQQMTERNCILV
mmetsp:Transcript_27203/g.39852  ORF Transcript_27203/g.39852 Transcript_27203/m.39852 type:complete len:88 (-) Transcript_27203:86-349(-)